jgi:hypothetical protein
MSKLSDPSLVFKIPQDTVKRSLTFMQKKGVSRHEGVVLWPGRLISNICEVGEPVIPQQITGERYYRIPDEETFRIIQRVSEQGLVIPIQIHSHPRAAFHSPVDDEYAFVQHENAISIVVPNFANFTAAEFLSRARFYRLHAGNTWKEMERAEIDTSLQFENL